MWVVTALQLTLWLLLLLLLVASLPSQAQPIHPSRLYGLGQRLQQAGWQTLHSIRQTALCCKYTTNKKSKLQAPHAAHCM